MAERKFDYENVASVYKEIQRITGEPSDTESVAGILYTIDKDVHDCVDVCDMALYGDLGKQLLLDWDNASSNFDNFVTNFNNWSTLVAQSASNYSKFEQDIVKFRSENPLGATSGGIAEAYTNTGFYSNSYTSEEIEQFAAIAQIHELTGSTYVDTGMVSFAAKNKTYNIVSDLLNVAGIVASGFSIAKIGKAGFSYLNTGYGANNNLTKHKTLVNLATKAAQGTEGLKHTGKFATTYAKLLLIGGKTSSKISTGFWNSIKTAASGAAKISGVAAGSGVMSAITYAIGSDYDASKYATGASTSVVSGQAVTIGNSNYSFLGVTPNGTNLYMNEQGEVCYVDSNNAVVKATAVDSNGMTVSANLETMTDNFRMYIGNEVITQDTALVEYAVENYTNYYDSLENIITTTTPIEVSGAN